ncbi:MAG: hypothetical protein QM731_07260 [Chitinophagaceae bacterium]
MCRKLFFLFFFLHAVGQVLMAQKVQVGSLIGYSSNTSVNIPAAEYTIRRGPDWGVAVALSAYSAKKFFRNVSAEFQFNRQVSQVAWVKKEAPDSTISSRVAVHTVRIGALKEITPGIVRLFGGALLGLSITDPSGGERITVFNCTFSGGFKINITRIVEARLQGMIVFPMAVSNVVSGKWPDIKMQSGIVANGIPVAANISTGIFVSLWNR